MKTITPCISLIMMLSLAFSSRGQNTENKNSVNGGFIAVPLGDISSIVLDVEYERFLNAHNSLSMRLDYLGYSIKDGATTTTGTGGGVGFSYKHYFSKNGYGGFYLAPSIELIATSWESTEYDYNYTYYNDGTSFNICPNVTSGYRFNFGNYFSLTPSVMLGYRAGISIESKASDATAESGPFGGVGLSFGARF